MLAVVAPSENDAGRVDVTPRLEGRESEELLVLVPVVGGDRLTRPRAAAIEPKEGGGDRGPVAEGAAADAEPVATGMGS